MSVLEIKEHEDGTATLYEGDRVCFSGSYEECQEEMFRIFEKTMAELAKISQKKS